MSPIKYDDIFAPVRQIQLIKGWLFPSPLFTLFSTVRKNELRNTPLVRASTCTLFAMQQSRQQAALIRAKGDVLSTDLIYIYPPRMQFSLAAREWLVGCMWDGKQRLCRADHYEERKRAGCSTTRTKHTHMYIACMQR
jgi:hypothetical protein